MSLEPTILSIPSLSEEEKKSRNKMSVIIGLILSVVVVSFYVVTLVKLQGNVAEKLVLDQKAAASKAETMTKNTTVKKEQAH